MWRCSKCGTRVSDDDYFCSKCGKESKRLKKETICEICGASIEPGHGFCTVCGADITDDKYRSEAEKHNNHTILILFLILIATILVFFGYIWWLIKKDTTKYDRAEIYEYYSQSTLVQFEKERGNYIL